MNVISLPSRHFKNSHVPPPQSRVDLKDIPSYTQSINGQEVNIDNNAYAGSTTLSPNATNSTFDFRRTVQSPGGPVTGNPVFNNSRYFLLATNNPQNLNITAVDGDGTLIGGTSNDVHRVNFGSNNPNSVNKLLYDGGAGNDTLTISGNNGFLHQTTRNTWASNVGNDTYNLVNANNMSVILGEDLMTENPNNDVSLSNKSTDTYNIGQGNNNIVIIQDVAAASASEKDTLNLYGSGWQNEGVAFYDVQSSDGTQPGYSINRYNKGNYEKWRNTVTGSQVYIAKDPVLQPNQPANNFQINANVPQPPNL